MGSPHSPEESGRRLPSFVEGSPLGVAARTYNRHVFKIIIRIDYPQDKALIAATVKVEKEGSGTGKRIGTHFLSSQATGMGRRGFVTQKHFFQPHRQAKASKFLDII